MEKRGTQDRTVQTEMKHHWTEDAGKPYVPLTLLTILYHIDCTEKPAIGEENLSIAVRVKYICICGKIKDTQDSGTIAKASQGCTENLNLI